MKKFVLRLRFVIVLLTMLIINCSIVFATAPKRSTVETIVIEGIETFFGALAGIAVVFGGVEFFQAFLAYRENEEEGGSGEANSKIGKRILAGVFCLIGAVVAFTIMNWVKILFNLD